MGKNTDKLYITHSEWGSEGYSASGGTGNTKVSIPTSVSSLPFWYCSISQQPIGEDCGVVDNHGHVYDIRNVMPYIRKHNQNPVSGEELTDDTKKLVKLKLQRNSEGKYVDPVTLKEFQTASHVVVIMTSGRAYFYDTIKEHNIKQRFWRDLVSDEEFKKIDIVKLIGGAGVRTQKSKPEIVQTNGGGNIRKKMELKQREEKTESSLTTHHMSSSVTSTAMDVSTEAKYKDVPIENKLKPKRFNELGYATIETDLGNINIELSPKYSPKAVYNFITLAKQGYYDGIVFHRNIKHFMVQTGDPTGTGRGGRSAFSDGKPFADETNTPMKHESRGILAMANRGKNTNTSQFFITYRRCPHLDGKHTVFGKVVGGMDVLNKLEMVPVDEMDRPKQPIKMNRVKVLVDPFERQMDQAKEEQVHEDKDLDDSPWLKKNDISSVPVGKYFQQQLTDINNKHSIDSFDDNRKKRKLTSLAQSSFTNW
jgi:peptidyl-prolyl cis-trans isomerase-like protein 2